MEKHAITCLWVTYIFLKYAITTQVTYFFPEKFCASMSLLYVLYQGFYY